MAHWANVRFFGLIFLLTLSFVAIGQEQPLDAKKWEEVTKDIDYNEKVEEPKKDVNMPKFDLGISKEVIKYTFFTIVLSILIYFLVRYLINLQGTGTSKEEFKITVNSLQEAEENPMESDLEKLIAKLIAEEKFREATRAYFLFLLQQLFAQKQIEWHKRKTNFDYLREVNGKEFYDSFKQLTQYFELVWYGGEAVTKQQFIATEPEFLNLVKRIGNEKK
jgi:hypothetical protein